jgi:hypothetical protein
MAKRMTSNSIVSHDGYDVQQSMSLDLWGDRSHYAPTRATSVRYKLHRRHLISPIDNASPQQTASQKNRLVLLQVGD